MSTIDLKPLKRLVTHITIIGETELITHNWSEKAKRNMLAKQMGQTVEKEFKNPEADYEASFYRLPDGSPGIPATAFKGAIVSAARTVKGIYMTTLRISVFVKHDGIDVVNHLPCVRIQGVPYMREDMVRLETGVADIRYRPGFPEGWTAELRIKHDPSVISIDQLVNLVDRAGSVGVGEWRPGSKESNTGWAGTFRVDLDKTVISE